MIPLSSSYFRCYLPPPPPPPPITARHVSATLLSSSPSSSSSCRSSDRDRSNRSVKPYHCLQKLLLTHAFAGALSLSLSLLAPFAAAAEDPLRPPPPPTAELCREAEAAEGRGATPAPAPAPEAVTDEGLVEEAWEVVYDSFLPDAGDRPWSPEMWMEKKQEILRNKIQTRSRAHDIIRNMLASLADPYTRFLSPSEFSKMAKYDVTGIGMNLREVPDDNGSVKLKVLGIILDGPAHSAGVRQGDELLSVNGINVQGKSAFDVSSMLQGPKETYVTIEVKHGACGPLQSMKVQRQLVARTPVFYRLEKMENGDSSVGYIHVKEFNALAKKDLVTALRRLQSAGASYFILDLRDNLGGLVQVIYTAGRDPQVQNTIVAETEPLITSPLIVLVNNRTASASEIVASALHDNCKGILVGERTFGKGLIQSVFELHDDSGVVVTIGKYVTPNHKDINGNGIEPDLRRIPALNEVKNLLSQCRYPGMG
ncbi:carboxyl-terminal-processing peptidase 1, chloroplastic isoform X2 [Ananas comosus]|uniref:Carboxyl-terminal-processing peptidase 1, chloroplastic isoform X2 n=1 Tax=Ananas comosus TaxID=4615 RepID=A0A6P5G025_ANACO|nr:carboxyl-terminal-processing peptidase 1, chloroplastic isoform X2 [Ananas comosus]